MASKKLSDVYINSFFTIAGPMEKNGAIKSYDVLIDDYYYNEKSFEKAQVKMQQDAIEGLLFKSKTKVDDINYLIGGDLSNQIAVTSYTASEYPWPFIGVYSACASFVESLIIASMLVKIDSKKSSMCISSSHNLYAEKQFRFPTEYGSIKNDTSTFTSTGAVSSIVSSEPSKYRIESYTIGSVVDKGIIDSSNMGAVMAPAAAKTIYDHLNDLKRDISYYDLILTGDLGCVGEKILKEYMKEVYNIDLKNYQDCGCKLYLKSEKETMAGASGPIVLPLYLFSTILKEKKYKRILIVGTGSLHNTFFVNQKESIRSIAHAVSLEVLK